MKAKRQWLKQVALIGMSVAVILVVAMPVSAQESHPQMSTAEKLTAIQGVLRSHRFAASTQPRGPNLCAALIRDFTTVRNIRAIEPVVVATSKGDPALKKWRQCDDASIYEMKTDDVGKDGYSGLWGLGGPPYRYYRLEVDGNPKNGPEDVLYHETFRDETGRPLGYGSSAYSWVDLEGCAMRGQFGVPWITSWNETYPSNLLRIHAPVTRKGEAYLLELYTYSDDPTGSRYRFKVTPFNTRNFRKAYCSWEETTNAH